MFRQFIIAFLITYCNNLSVAQSTYFDSTYNLFDGTEYARAIFQDTNGYFIFGGTKPANFGFKPCVLKVDFNGNKIFKKTITDTTYNNGIDYTNTNFIRDIDGGFLFASTSQNTNTSEIEVVLMKFNYQGDSVFTKRIPNTGGNNWYIHAAVQNIDSSYLLVGKEYVSQENTKILIIKVSKDGDFIWSKVHGNSIDIRKVQSIVRVNDGYIIGGYRTIGASFYGHLAKIDTDGNILWQQTLPDMGLIANLKKLSDGNYMAVGYHTHIHYPGNSSYGNCLAVKFSENGSIIWNKNYGRVHQFGSFLNFLELNDGNYLFIGSQGGDEEVSLEDAFILKTTPDGDSLWARVNDRCGLMSVERYVDIIEKEDGSFIVAGSFWMGCTPDFWVVGLDSFGCHEQGCQYLFINENSESDIDNEFKLYPNPSESIFNIGTTINKFSVQVFNTSGSLIFENMNSPTHIDLSRFDSGIYIVEFMCNDKLTRKRIIKH